ncbi:hypothetical protein DSOL_0622 [Desulfosporosinus metallidurans]|uniref:Uncharacterized protein n=1 Tax=Desulfosporosinus metallidurans TaxID=1888891 RepID=A0A1Q8R1D6_9FIRM|nr:hypothetical protein DSOL_0622 [Desulfosporosinus metallidurans]
MFIFKRLYSYTFYRLKLGWHRGISRPKLGGGFYFSQDIQYKTY